MRLRSIGDTVLATPSLIALRRFLPAARIDILLEDWVAPVLENFDAVDNIISVPTKATHKAPGGTLSSKELLFIRSIIAWELRKTKYDVAFNLHGGTTAAFFVRAAGAKYRVGFATYQYNFLYTHLAASPLEFWQTEHAHSAEQQLALLGSVGVPVAGKPKSRLVVGESARASIEQKLKKSQIPNPKSQIALIHPVAAFDTKQWATENFAEIVDYLAARGIFSVAVAARREAKVIEELSEKTSAIFHGFTDLTLPEITALAARAQIFVGNDSGIAHIAAAVDTPSVVIFGPSNINHWRPWTNAPNEIVYSQKACEHQLDEIRKGSENPKCIRCVTVEAVCEAIERVLQRAEISVAEKRGERLN